MANYTIGLAGLQNTSLAIDTTSNNIANANTVGYKAGDYVFADQYFKAVNPSDVNRVGLGSERLAVRRPLTYGTINNSANPLDMAIGGDGWFRVLTNPNDPTSLNYTRNGQFAVDKNGWIVNENGMYLTGYQPSADGTSVTDDIRGLGTTNGKLRMPADFANGVQTKKSTITAILDSRENAFTTGISGGTGVAFDPNQNTFNSQTTQTIFDSNGASHTLNVYYRRVTDKTLNITVNSNGYSYPPGPNHSANTLNSTQAVTLPPTSTLTVDTAPSNVINGKVLGYTTTLTGSGASATQVIYPAADTTLSHIMNGTSSPNVGDHVFMNGVDTGLTVSVSPSTSNSPGTVTALDGLTLKGTAVGSFATSTGALNVPPGAVFTFYPDGTTLDMHLVAPDGTSIPVKGLSNNPALNKPLTATMERVEVYASIDGKFYNKTDTNTRSDNPQTPEVSDTGYGAVAVINMVAGRNVDSLITDAASGLPVFSTKTKLTTLVSNGSQQSSTIPLIFDLDLSGTQLQASSFQVTQNAQDGEPRSQLSSVTIDSSGMIVGVYGNGRQIVAGQIALAHFDASEQLVPTGGNSFAPSYRSGTEGENGVRLGRPGEGSFGAIKSQAVEQSNVDLSNELVKLMLLQRVYSANSQSLRAFDQTMQDTIRMVG